jgi:capsular exopolysaccharide synthesis family protein
MSVLGSLTLRAPGQAGRVRVKEEVVIISAPVSPGAEQFRGLRHSIERLRRDHGTKVIAVTSAGPGDGKSVTTLNLAGSLAQSAGTRVLLVDADLHKASVATYLGLARDRGPGLAEALASSSLTLADVVRRIESINISVVFAGDAHPRPYELLGSSRIEPLLAEMREQFDYVLIDTPPVVPVADGRFLSRWVDGVIVVVAAHKTKRKMVAEALRLLDGSKVLGLVFNGDDRPLRDYYNYYGSRTSTTSGAVRRRPPIP